MKPLVRVIVIALALLAFAISVSSAAFGQYPKFIGEADTGVMLITPRHRIAVWTGGFDSPHPKWAKKKTFNKCMAADLPESSCLAAQDYVRLLTSDGELASEIDNAADHVIAVWATCGEPYASFARRFDFSRITITVKDTAFSPPGSAEVDGGVTMDGGRTVWIVDLFFQGWFSDRAHASLATMGQFANWELANCVVWAYYGHVKDIGDSVPCR